jgi:ABC-type transport system involved in multi-copper enzyme maturation permease subunit
MSAAVFPLVLIHESGGLVLPLFTVFLLALLVSGGLSDGSVKLTLLRPVRRRDVILAEFAAVALFVAVESRSAAAAVAIGAGVGALPAGDPVVVVRGAAVSLCRPAARARACRAGGGAGGSGFHDAAS